MKKLLCILLALAMCLSLLSVGVLAEAEADDLVIVEEDPALDGDGDKAGEEGDDPAGEIPTIGAELGDEEDLNDLVASVEIADVTHLVTDTYIARWAEQNEYGEFVITGPYEFSNVEPESMHVYMKDGREFVGNPDDVWELLYDTYDFDFFVEWLDIEGWTVGETLDVGDHTVYYRVGDMFTEYTVHIIDSPVASVEAEDATHFITDVGGAPFYRDPETGAPIFLDGPWEVNPSPSFVKVTLQDGREFSAPSLGDIAAPLREAVGCEVDMTILSDQTPDETWDVGEHRATVIIGGVEDTYNVTVIENPITSVTVEPITRLETDLDWGITTYKEIDVGEPWRVDCWPRDAEVSVSFTDGTSIVCPCDELLDRLPEKLGFDVDIWWDSDEDHGDIWGPGEYTARLHVAGVEGEYTVNVVKNPVVSVEVEDIIRYDTDLSEWTDYFDPELDEWVDPGYRWRIECWPEIITVVTDDGEVFSDYAGVVWDALSEKYGFDFRFEWDVDQEPGVLPEPGEYNVRFNVGGVGTEYNVTVFENPVASVSVADFSRPITNLSGWTEYYDPELDEEVDPGFEWRVDCWPKEITVTMKDGKVISGYPEDVEVEINDEYGFYADMHWDSDEPFTGEIWALGDHAVTFYFCGVPADYTVTVIEDPLLNLEVEPLTRYEDVRVLSMWYDEETGEVTGPYRLLWLAPDSISVTLTNGKTYTGNSYDVAEQIYDDTGCYMDSWWSTVNGEIPDESWGPGNYMAYMTFGSARAEFPVTVLESPIESIEIAPVTVSVDDRIDRAGYFDTEKGEFIFVDWRSVDCYPSEITVTLKNGDSFTCELDELEEKLYEHAPDYPAEIYWDSSETPENLWDAGEHEAALVLNGTEYPFIVHVTEGKPAPTLTISADGKKAEIEGDYAGLYVRVALVVQLSGGRSGLYITQGVINKDGSILVPAFYVPGLTVVGVNVTLVKSISDISNPTPKPVATATFFYNS